MIREAIARTLRRLNLHSVLLAFPIFGKALYEGLSLEFERVNEYRDIVTSSVVANDNMDVSTLDDYEIKYGIDYIYTSTYQERIARIIERAGRNGSGGIDWFQDQIQKAGFDLYVILNEKNVSSIPQFGDFQFNDVQFGGAVLYTDPRTVDGELVVASPNGNIGGQFFNFGDYQFNDVQFGTLEDGYAYPRPLEYIIGSDPNKWGYTFFLSPFPDRVATSAELLQLSNLELDYLKKTIIQLKHLRNWCIAQVEEI